MILKELKKIILNRWIIALLFILCFFNVLLDVQATKSSIENFAQEESVQRKKIAEYSDYIINIEKNANTISTFELYNEDNNYQIQSAKKTVEAYKNLKNVKPVYGNYIAIGQFTKIGFSDIIIFLIMLQCAIVVMNTDVKCGMQEVLKACKKGRTRLSFGKIVALFLTDIIVTFSVLILHLGTLWLVYGCDTLNVPIQSVPEFYDSSISIMIWEYLLIFYILKCFVVLAYTLIIFLLANLFSNSGIIYSLSGIVIVLSFSTYKNILWDYASAILKIISPVTLVDIRAITCKYYNMNILGIPFNLMLVSVVVIILYLIIFSLLPVIVFSKNINYTLKIPQRIRKKKDNRKVFLKGMTFMEYKKLLVANKGLIIILILVLLQGFVLSEVDTEMSEEQKYYTSYMEKIEGLQSEKTEEYIKKEAKRYEKIQSEYEKDAQQYVEGNITDTVMLTIQDQYEWDMRAFAAFEKIEKQKKYLDKLENEKGIRGWFVNDIGVKYIINPKEIYSENIAWIFMMVALILLITACIAYEEQTGMDQLSDTMIYGTKKLMRRKIKVSVVIATLVFIISNLPYLLLILSKYKFGGVMAPLKSMKQFSSFVFDIPIIIYLIFIYILKYFICLIAMFLIIFIAKKCKGHIKKIAISITVIIIPLLIFTIQGFF